VGTSKGKGKERVAPWRPEFLASDEDEEQIRSTSSPQYEPLNTPISSITDKKERKRLVRLEWNVDLL
jgi:hypothetical protein